MMCTPRLSFRSIRVVVLAIAIAGSFVGASAAFGGGGVYKCKSASGTAYQNVPCTDGNQSMVDTPETKDYKRQQLRYEEIGRKERAQRERQVRRDRVELAIGKEKDPSRLRQLEDEKLCLMTTVDDGDVDLCIADRAKEHTAQSTRTAQSLKSRGEAADRCRTLGHSVAKRDGTVDERADDLAELCKDWVYYKAKAYKYGLEGNLEQAAAARTSFEQVNRWLSAYSEEDVTCECAKHDSEENLSRAMR